MCDTVTLPPDRLPSACECPSPKSSVELTRLLLPVALLTVNDSVTLFAFAFACTEEHEVPLPADATAHVIVMPGPDRIPTATVADCVPDAAVTVDASVVVKVALA